MKLKEVSLEWDRKIIIVIFVVDCWEKVEVGDGWDGIIWEM